MSGFPQNIRFARTVDGLRIGYAVSGRGYPLVRAGTWMSHIEHDWRMQVFGPLFRALGTRDRFHRYDPRGYGLSEGKDADISLDTLISDLSAVVDDAGLDRFALWGGAGAGSVASIAYAACHPERVSHLLLTAPIARGRLTARATVEEKERFLAFVKLIELGWGDDNPAFRQILATEMFPRATAAQTAELNQLFRTCAKPRQAARMATATGLADVSSQLTQIAVPTLVVHCRGSLLVPLEEARLVASSIRNARFVLLETDNYIPLEGEPAFTTLLAEIEAFLPRREALAREAALSGLTRREREVLALLANGLDNSDIAARLGIAEKTVRNTVSHIFDKLAVKSRAHAIVLARHAGLGD